MIHPRSTSLPVHTSVAPLPLDGVSGSERKELSAEPPGESPAPAPARRGINSDYAELKRRVRAAGLLEARPASSVSMITRTLALLALSLGLLLVLDRLWLQLLDAALLAIAFTQIGFIGHDTGHGQIVASGWKRDLLSLVHGNLLLGISASWWVDKHNQHHSRPNQLDLDPDIDFPILAFSREQAERMRGAARIIGRYQAFFLFPLLTLEGLSLRLSSLDFLRRNTAKHKRIEIALLLGHVAWYCGLLFALLGFWHALLFIVVHQALFGVYIGSVFAPNHKGMLVLDKDSDLDFLRRQVLTARNVRGNPLTDFWYGGLNYQIEHHLFPTMPRANLAQAQKIVRAFCAAHSIPYHETSIIRSYREILQFLHMIGEPLRQERTVARV